MHSELRLLNKQRRKEWGEGNPGMVVTQCRQNMKHEKARRSTANILWLIVCCTLFLVGGKYFHNLFAVKVPNFRHSSSSAEAAAAADDVSIANAFVTVCSP